MQSHHKTGTPNRENLTAYVEMAELRCQNVVSPMHIYSSPPILMLEDRSTE